MMLPFSLFLALKYLKPKRSYFSVITIISLMGVLLGVAVLIIVLSVMSGFDEMWREKILSFNAHVTVARREGIEDVAATMRAVCSLPDVVAVAPTIEGPVVIQHQGRIYTPVLRGVDPQLERRVSAIPTSLVRGVFDLRDNGVVIGKDLADRMGVQPGDTLLVNAPRSFMSKDEIHLPEELVVRGIFEVGMWEYDMGFLLTSLEMSQELNGLEAEALTLRVMVRDPYRAYPAASQIRRMLGPDWWVETWIDQNRQLFSALRVEKNMMFFLLIFIAVVAAFGITNTLITVTIQKTREIGLLKAMGCSNRTITGVFFWQGWLQGMVGTGAGILTGLYILHERNSLMHWLSDTFHLELFPKELYRLTEIPAKTAASDVAIVAFSVIIICTLAGLIPAHRAARLDPVQALRNE